MSLSELPNCFGKFITRIIKYLRAINEKSVQENVQKPSKNLIQSMPPKKKHTGQTRPTYVLMGQYLNLPAAFWGPQVAQDTYGPGWEDLFHPVKIKA